MVNIFELLQGRYDKNLVNELRENGNKKDLREEKKLLKALQFIEIDIKDLSDIRKY